MTIFVLFNYKCNINPHARKEDRYLSKREVIKALNVHLFSPLSGGNCVIDVNVMEEDNCVCSCGCSTPVHAGPTGIGVESCWHGFVDMVVSGNELVNTVQTSDLTEKVKMVVGVKTKENLLDSRFQSSVIAETITNSFAEVNRNPAVSGLPIPAFGCTPDEILVFAYDCRNDMLLKKMVDLKLFHNDVKSATIVMLWLYINFTSFMRRDVTDTLTKPFLSEFTSEFCSSRQIESCYRKVTSATPEFYPVSNWPKLNFYSSAKMT
ncbi:uncharacterized protein LOC117344797 [Pecten maximus]|uniref:uncharacterized protein LOC117344797 n=1 Tax=Pecten maximus TaxID=6579 RepID=UPI001458C9B5|nr:uncharacterized protein LOC117344797 [Pecten maximus]